MIRVFPAFLNYLYTERVSKLRMCGEEPKDSIRIMINFVQRGIFGKSRTI